MSAQGPDGRAVAGQGLGLCSRSQTLPLARPLAGRHGFWPLEGLALLSLLLKKKEILAVFFWGGVGGRRMVGDSFPAWARGSGALGVRGGRDKGGRGVIEFDVH